MFPNNLSGRERYLLLITAVVVSTAFLYAFIIGPAASRWKNLNNQIQSKLDTIENDSKILANQKMIEDEYARISKSAKSAKNSEQAVADTLAFIENVSRNDACLITNIKPIDIVDTTLRKEVLIDVNAEANISQFSKFLYDIENPRENLINIKRLTLNSKSGQTGALKGTFLISKILLD